MKPRGNVVVRLCTIECSFSQPLATGPQNAAFRADIEGWAAVAPRLYIWDYVTDFANYLCPHPNFRVLAPNIRCFADHNAIGNFNEWNPFASYEPGFLARFRAAGERAAPDPCKGLSDDDWIEIQDNEFALFSPGAWVRTVDDPKASDGHAAMLTTNHTQWAIQWHIPSGFTGRWHVYVHAGCVAKANEGDAFHLGVYDSNARAAAGGKTMRIEECPSLEYRTFDLGVLELKPGMYFWAAPMNNPDQVASISVDRLLLVRE